MAEPIEMRWECVTALALSTQADHGLDKHNAPPRNCEHILQTKYLSLTTLPSRWRTHQARQFREAEGRRKPVEKRKTTKHFLDFIKSSQSFYRGYILSLTSLFDGVRELEAVAKRLAFSMLSMDEQTQVPEHLRQAVLLSCHQTLIRLGDLSRWRETQLVTKDRNWGPAIGYYHLAGTIYAASGACHHQLAVIALVDDDHFRSIYHLYRALAVAEPHPSARGNLEIELHKMAEILAKGGPTADISGREDSVSKGALTGSFLRLHATFSIGCGFLEHSELEREAIKQLVNASKERSKEASVRKIVLINLAAEYYAGMRLREDPQSVDLLQSLLCFMRLNIGTFSALLHVLESELELSGDNSPRATNKNPSASAKLTARVRRVLPSLGQYSSWLISQAAILAGETADASLNASAGELGNLYVRVINLLITVFSISDLPCVDYLLEENEETIGFAPLDGPEYDRMKRRYYVDDFVTRKPKSHDKGVKRLHPPNEMLARVRDLLEDGLYLHSQENIPIYMYEGRFFYREGHLPIEGDKESQFRNSVTHISETRLFSPDPPSSGGAPRTFSIMEEAPHDQSNNLANPQTMDMRRNGEEPADDANTTSYGLIDSSAVREHFGDLALLQRSAEPEGSSFKQTKSSPSRSNLLNGSPFQQQQQQQQQSTISVEETISSMPDPTDPASIKTSLHRTEQILLKHRPRISGSQAARDDTAFMSSNIFTGSNQTLSAQSQTAEPSQRD
ncbi:MAG: hypothetical protein Q9217_002519 [Psora testacea]